MKRIVIGGLNRNLFAALGTSLMLGAAMPVQAQTTTNITTVTTTTTTTVITPTNTTSVTNIVVKITTTPVTAHWESSAAIGLTITRGNSSTELYTGNVQSDRKSPQDEWLLEADGAYGAQNGIKNTGNAHGSGQYNYLATERLYGGLNLDILHDDIAAIDYRATVAPLIGYYFVKGKNTSLAAEIGPALVDQRLNGVTSDYASLRLGERFEHKFSATTRLWQSLELLPQVDRIKNYYFTGEIGVEAALTAKTALRSYIDDSYYNVPATGRLKNDVKWVTAVAYKF